MSQLVIAYWRHAKAFYRRGDESNTSLASIRVALRSVRQMFGMSPAAEFEPRALQDL